MTFLKTCTRSFYPERAQKVQSCLKTELPVRFVVAGTGERICASTRGVPSASPTGPKARRPIITATHDLKMIDVSDRIFWIRDCKVDRIETRAEVAVGAVE